MKDSVKKIKSVVVVHVYNPSYLEGRGGTSASLRPAQA
jgi:hypothetical protein